MRVRRAAGVAWRAVALRSAASRFARSCVICAWARSRRTPTIAARPRCAARSRCTRTISRRLRERSAVFTASASAASGAAMASFTPGVFAQSGPPTGTGIPFSSSSVARVKWRWMPTDTYSARRRALSSSLACVRDAA